jgi:hypothetical protein
LTGGVRYLGENAMNRCMGNLIAGLLAFSPAAQGQQLEDRETIGFQNASQWNSRFSVNDYNAESGARVFDNGWVPAGDGFTISAVTDPRGNIRLHVHSVSEDDQQCGDQDFWWSSPSVFLSGRPRPSMLTKRGSCGPEVGSKTRPRGRREESPSARAAA